MCTFHTIRCRDRFQKECSGVAAAAAAFAVGLENCGHATGATETMRRGSTLATTVDLACRPPPAAVARRRAGKASGVAAAAAAAAADSAQVIRSSDSYHPAAAGTAPTAPTAASEAITTAVTPAPASAARAVVIVAVVVAVAMIAAAEDSRTGSKCGNTAETTVVAAAWDKGHRWRRRR